MNDKMNDLERDKAINDLRSDIEEIRSDIDDLRSDDERIDQDLEGVVRALRDAAAKLASV